jgi:Ca2+/Na+ antiporter
MEGFMYPATLIFLTLVAWMFYRDNSLVLMSLAIFVAIYVVYSQETGHTATEFKNNIIKDIDQKTPNYSNRYSNDDF